MRTQVYQELGQEHADGRRIWSVQDLILVNHQSEPSMCLSLLVFCGHPFLLALLSLFSFRAH
jgi:hypothetical protein